MMLRETMAGVKWWLSVAALIAVWSTGCLAAVTEPPKDVGDLEVRESLFTGRVITSPDPHVNVVAEWDFADKDMWPLTHRDSNAQNLRIEEGALKFTMGAPKVTLGFGNFVFGQATKFKMLSFRGTMLGGATISLKRRQSKPVGTWSLDFRYQGDPKDAGVWGIAQGWGPPRLDLAASNKAGEWETVSVGCLQVAEADGMGLQIAGELGTEIEIDQIRIVQPVYDIYTRKTFELAREPIFLARATISTSVDLWINGQRALRSTQAVGELRYEFTAIDLMPYLQPGKNVIAIREFMPGTTTPTCYFQGAIQLASGQTIPLETDFTWKASAREEPGWIELKFDDSKWVPPASKDYSNYLNPQTMKPYIGYNPARLPVSCGQVDLRNPYQGKLYYNDAKPVIFQVRLPGGLAPLRPTVEYAIWSESPRQKLGEGIAAGGYRKGEALVYEINAGKLARGVYTLLLDAGGGKNPQLTRQELFMVVGKIPMPETDGQSWDADLKLTLVEQVNCADPNDPHPFKDAGAFKPEYASKMVTRNGMTYRETGVNNQYAWFGYQVKFRNLNRWHWIVIDYPDDAPRMMEVMLLPLKRRPITGPYASETAWAMPGFQVGAKYPNTNRMQQLRFLVLSNYEEAAILISRAGGPVGAGAAAAKISIYEIDQLPALQTRPAGRLFGLMTERHTVMNRTYSGMPDLRTPAGNPYVQWMQTAERYAQYCRFTGQNVYFMGSYQYTRTNTGITFDTGDEGCSLVPEFREIFINVLGANGIDTVSAIEYRVDQKYWHEGWPALHQALQGADLMFQVDKEGIDHGGNYQRENPMTSPLARQALRDNFAFILKRFGAFPSFKGLALIFAAKWEGPCYDSGDLSFDDQTIRLFEKETGIKVPVTLTTTERFAKRYEWIMANAREKWFDWRSERMAQVHDEMARLVKQARPDMDYYVVIEFWEDHIYGEKPRPFLEVARDYGYDPRVYAKRKDYYFGRDIWSYDPAGGGGGVSRWQWLRDPEVVRLFNEGSGAGRVAFVRWGFDEWTIGPLVAADPPVFPGGYFAAYVTPGHRYLAERFTTMLIDSDIDTFEYGFCDSSATVGGEQEMREFVRAFVSLPKARFTRLTGNGLDKNIAIKEAQVGKDYYIYVANPGWWEVEVRITVKGQGRAPIVCTVDGKQIRLEKGKVLSVKLDSYGLTAFQGQASMLKPVKAEVTISEEGRNYITGEIARYSGLLADAEKAKALSAEEHKLARSILGEAKAAAEAGDLVTAWYKLIHWPFVQAMRQLAGK